MADEQAQLDGASMKQMANAIRFLSMEAVERANSGHPGMPMGMADVATVLFTTQMKFDASDPNWFDRDRFVLSAGHGSMLVYSLSYLLGYDGMSIDDIKAFRQFGSKTAGHPEYGHAPGIETTTGPLGQGLGNAVGMAIAEANLNAKFGSDLIDHYTYVMAGDGCLMEGISQESISLAGHLKLNKLIVLWDDNEISIDGPISLSDSTDQLQRFEASGWETARVDGHDMAAVATAIEKARQSDKPTLIACRTTIGMGAPTKAGKSAAHGAPLGGGEIAGAREALDWPHAPFEVPEATLNQWRSSGTRSQKQREDWTVRLSNADHKDALEHAIAGDFQKVLQKAIRQFKKDFAKDPTKVATRKSSELVLNVLNDVVVETIGGSADLTGSNNTKSKEMSVLSADNYAGRYIYYGIREHGMAAAMNGMALHGGVVPYGGTFMAFTDYCRPSIRLAALMGIRSIFVMTHDSIGLGEDGPTHQPVEHLSALRVIPNLNVFRPCDSVETAECWELAVGNKNTPSILALTRQGLEPARTEYDKNNLSANGAYIVADAPDPDVVLIASGSEVEIAIKAQATLACKKIRARVVSAPCFELFEQRSKEYQKQVLGKAPRIGVEAAMRQGWDLFLRRKDKFIGMSGFGASAPASELYQHFGITPDAVVKAAKDLIS